MIEKMKIESDDGFLHLEDLPHNRIFNKVVTGCGGTTVVLQNTEDYVIAVPTMFFLFREGFSAEFAVLFVILKINTPIVPIKVIAGRQYHSKPSAFEV